MKRNIIFSILFLFILVFCKPIKIENSEQAFDYVKGIKNYTSDVRITFKNERNEESIFLRQYSCYNGSYRLDLEEERIYIYADDKIFVEDLKNKKKYFLEENFDEVYKYSFLNEYIKLIYSMDQVEYFKEFYDDGNKKIDIYGAKVNLPINNLNINSATLYLDGEKFSPIRLEIFDIKGNIRILVEYLTFEVLEKIDLQLFEY